MLVEINSLHWLLLYLWITIRDKPSAAMMTKLPLQEGGACPVDGGWGDEGSPIHPSASTGESNEQQHFMLHAKFVTGAGC